MRGLAGSLTGRLLLVATLVLSAFLGITGWSLERAHENSSREAQEDRLEEVFYALLGADAGDDEQGRLRIPPVLPNPGLTNPDSGLYAWVKGLDDGYQWRSPSAVGRSAPLFDKPFAARKRPHVSIAEDVLLLRFDIAQVRPDESGEWRYQITIQADLFDYKEQLRAYRGTLWGWLAGAGLLLLMVQLVVLRWGLRPVLTLSAQVHDIQEGKREVVDEDVPSELYPLARNLNLLVRRGQSQLERYRNSLGDLAHSLKTPVAVLRGALHDNDAEECRRNLREQLPRVQEILDYQLQRAAVAGGGIGGQSIRIAPLVRRICDTLEKVYRDGDVHCEHRVDEDLEFRADEGDLMELLGNLVDNACKHGCGRVRVSVIQETDDALNMVIEDDGPGVPADDRNRILDRGHRLDERTPGQGIGLAMIKEIIAAYHGSMEIDDSELGGAAFRVVLREG